VVLRERRDYRGRFDISLLSVDAFKVKFANEKYEVNGSPVSIGLLWLNSRNRRDLDGICFLPTGIEGYETGAETPDGWYNLWRGFAVTPDPSEAGLKKLDRLKDHILQNVAMGDEKISLWVWGFFAHMYQRPMERVGVALALRGGQGSGKTILGKIMGHPLGPHYALISSAKHLTGEFNAHMKSTLLLQADEGFWAGDKAAEGVLKSLVSSEEHFIEGKGLDAVPVLNLICLLITSNNDWVVPAGMDERRMAVLDIGEGRKQNRAYFKAIEDDMKSGGYEALLHYLLTFDLTQVDLGTIPKTAALLEQKIESLSTEQAFWFEVLQRGAPWPGTDLWIEKIDCERLFKTYVQHSELIGVRRRASQTKFGSVLHKLIPDLRKERPWVHMENERGEQVKRRRWVYAVPDLTACRQFMDEKLGQPVNWPKPPPPDDPEGAGENPSPGGDVVLGGKGDPLHDLDA
jgi:hypothetical protein